MLLMAAVFLIIGFQANMVDKDVSDDRNASVKCSTNPPKLHRCINKSSASPRIESRHFFKGIIIRIFLNAVTDDTCIPSGTAGSG